MRTSVADACAAMRAADPVAADDFAGAWQTPQAQALLADVSAQVFSDARPLRLGVEPRVRVSQRFAHRWVGAAVAAAAALLLVAVTGLVLMHRLGSSSSAPARPAVPAPPTPATRYQTSSADPHFAQTIDELGMIVRSVPVPPGSEPSHGPLPLLPISATQGLDNQAQEIDRALWYTSTADLQSTMAFFKQSDAEGLVTQGGQTTVMRRFPASSAHNEVSVGITVVSTSTGVAMRVQASTSYLSSTLPPGYIPADVTALDITIARAARAPTVHRTLDGPAIAQVATALRALPTMGTGGDYFGCDPVTGEQDQVSFTQKGHQTVIVYHLDGCLQTIATYDGKEVQEFDSGNSLNTVLLEVLGLPKNYGYTG